MNVTVPVPELMTLPRLLSEPMPVTEKETAPLNVTVLAAPLLRMSFAAIATVEENEALPAVIANPPTAEIALGKVTDVPAVLFTVIVPVP